MVHITNIIVYYEEIKQELKRILVHECRCNERLKAKAEGSTRLACTGFGHWFAIFSFFTPFFLFFKRHPASTLTAIRIATSSLTHSSTAHNNMGAAALIEAFS